MLEHIQIPLSKRGYIFLLEHSRIKVTGGVLVYLKSESGVYKSYNIPNLNTSLLMIGEGSSITRDAVAMLGDSNTLLMFVGGKGLPLHGVSDLSFNIISPSVEYRPTKYMQSWAQIFFDETKRLKVAKIFMRLRIENIEYFFNKTTEIQEMGINSSSIDNIAIEFKSDVEKAKSTEQLLLAEARFTKKLYAFFARTIKLAEFTRKHGVDSCDNDMDIVNNYLDHGNYLCYGLASVSLHGLGISYAFPVLHGKTRRGALVFDIADLVKDSICLPLAFYCAINGNSDSEFREKLMFNINSFKVLDLLFKQIESSIEESFDA